jgi:hypothetical protein
MADTVSVRISRPVLDEIRVIARAHRRSITAELTVALDAYIEAEGPEARRILKARGQ